MSHDILIAARIYELMILGSVARLTRRTIATVVKRSADAHAVRCTNETLPAITAASSSELEA